jgi:hypothetical protein
MESRSALLGGEMKAALPPDMMLSTCVLDAVPPLMEPRSALEHRRKNPLTPYKADHWEQELRCAGLLERYSKVPEGFQSGSG